MKIIKDWRNRDWIWIVSILLGVIIIILTWRLNEKDNVVNIISMFASGASIILAVVAIVQSTIYNSSSNELYAKMTEKLSSLDNNVELVKSNILNNANKVIDEAPITEEIKEDIKINLENTLKDEYFNNRPIIHRANIGYFSERLISDMVKFCYSEEYNINYGLKGSDAQADIILENDTKIIPIEIKVCSKITSKHLDSVVDWIKKLKNRMDNPNKKQITVKVIIITTDDKSRIYFEKEWDVDIVIFTLNEISHIVDNRLETIFKEKMNI